MKQTFDLAANSKAMFFITRMSSDEMPPLPLRINSLTEKVDDVDVLLYPDVNRFVYKTDSQPGFTAEPVFVVLLKSRYRLPLANAIETVDLVADTVPSEIYLFDKHWFEEDEIAEKDKFHDHDLVAVKNHADVIVKAFTQDGIDVGDFDYRVTIDDSLWLHRPVNDDESETINWSVRGKAPRQISEQLSADKTVLTLAATDGFVQGNGKYVVKPQRGRLSGNEAVLLSRQRVVAAQVDLTTYRFRLPNLPPQVRYYFYCGHGPDERSCWCRRSVSLEIDTLEIFPDQGYLNISWRGHWHDSELTDDQYRELTINH